MREVYELLSNGFVRVPRVTVDVKGKGKMETRWPERLRSGSDPYHHPETAH